MSQQSDRMKASVTRYGFCNEEKEKKKETDKEIYDNYDNNN